MKQCVLYENKSPPLNDIGSVNAMQHICQISSLLFSPLFRLFLWYAVQKNVTQKLSSVCLMRLTPNFHILQQTMPDSGPLQAQVIKVHFKVHISSSNRAPSRNRLERLLTFQQSLSGLSPYVHQYNTIGSILKLYTEHTEVLLTEILHHRRFREICP